MMNFKKWLSILLAALMLLSVITVFAGCGETVEDPTGNDNGEEVQMGPGSVMVTGNGAGHALENRTNEPVELINLIVKK